MGKVEIIILVVVVLFITVFVFLFLDNSKKIKNNQQKQPEKKQDEVKKDDGGKAEKPENLKEVKQVMEDVSNQSENYLKQLLINDDGKKSDDINFAEVSEEEILKPIENDDEFEQEEKAIELGKKKNKVHVFDELEDDNFRENTTSVLNELDSNEETEQLIKDNTQSEIKLENFEEDDSVGEEFKNMSKRMKVLMVSNVFEKKVNNNDDDNIN